MYRTNQETMSPTYMEDMFLRDWFAGMAICGIAARATVGSADSVKRAYLIAEEMMEHRKRFEGDVPTP